MGPPGYLNFTIRLLFQIPNVVYICDRQGSQYSNALFSYNNPVIRSNGGVKGNSFVGVLVCLQAPRTLRVWET